MRNSRQENESGLIIDPALLADIQAACRRYAAELEAATSAESRLSSRKLSVLLQPFQTCQRTCGDSSKPRSQLFHGDNRRVPRTVSSAKRVLASGAGAASKLSRIPREAGEHFRPAGATQVQASEETRSS